MAIELPRYQRSTQAVRRGGINPAAGAPDAGLADILATFASQTAAKVTEQNVQAAGVEGFNETTESGELASASNITAAGRAYNEGAKLAHLSNIRLDIKTRLGELNIAARQLPAERWVEAFTTTADGLKSGLLEETLPEFRGEALSYFNELSGNQRLQLLDGQQASLSKDILTDLQLGQANLLDDITSAARELRAPALTVYQREYEAGIETAVDAGFMTDAQGLEAVRQMHSQALQNELLGAYDQVLEDEGLEAGKASLDRFMRADGSSMGLSAVEKDATEAGMRQAFSQRLALEAALTSDNTAQAKAAKAVLKQNSDDMIAALSNGQAPPGDVNTVYGALIEAEEFDRAIDLRNAVVTGGSMGAITATSLPEQRQALESLRARKDLSADELRLLDALEPAVVRTERMLNDDPRQLAREQQKVDDAPIDLSSGEALVESLAPRLENVAALDQHYQTAMAVVTDAEAEQIGRFWSGADIGEKLGIGAAISAALGPRAEDLMAQLDKKDYRVMAYAGSLQNLGDSGTAEAIMRGQALLAAPKEVDIMPEGTERADMDAHINAMLAESYQYLGTTRGTAIAAINAWYADRSNVSGDFSKQWDADRVNAAIDSVIGGLVEDRTGATNPLRGGTQDQFDAWLDSLNAEQISSFGGVAGLPPERVRDQRFIAVGNGRFWVTTPDPYSQAPQFLLRMDGKPLELVFNPDAIPQITAGPRPTPQF